MSGKTDNVARRMYDKAVEVGSLYFASCFTVNFMVQSTSPTMYPVYMYRSLIPLSSFMLKFIGKAGLSINFEADCKTAKEATKLNGILFFAPILKKKEAISLDSEGKFYW